MTNAESIARTLNICNIFLCLLSRVFQVALSHTHAQMFFGHGITFSSLCRTGVHGLRISVQCAFLSVVSQYSVSTVVQ